MKLKSILHDKKTASGQNILGNMIFPRMEAASRKGGNNEIPVDAPEQAYRSVRIKNKKPFQAGERQRLAASGSGITPWEGLLFRMPTTGILTKAARVYKNPSIPDLTGSGNFARDKMAYLWSPTAETGLTRDTHQAQQALYRCPAHKRYLFLWAK